MKRVFTLTDSAGTDLLKGGTTGIRVTQPCRADSLTPSYRYPIDSATRDTITVLSFENLLFPAVVGSSNVRPECFRIVFTYPSLEYDVMTWWYHMSDGECRSPIVGEMRFSDRLVAREATSDKAWNAYHLVRR